MTAFIVWTSVLSYLLITLVFARNRILHWHKDPSSLVDITDSTDRMLSSLAAISLGLIWPVALIFFALRDWLWKPADRDAERLNRLRADHRDWKQKAYDRTATNEERRMAADIANTLADIIKRSN